MSIEEVLVQVRTQLEEKIKRQLSGLQGLVAKPIYNSLMPLHGGMLTGPEGFELVFLNDGFLQKEYAKKLDRRFLKYAGATAAAIRVCSNPQNCILGAVSTLCGEMCRFLLLSKRDACRAASRNIPRTPMYWLLSTVIAWLAI
jgi:hypothetical protein